MEECGGGGGGGGGEYIGTCGGPDAPYGGADVA